MINMEEIIRIIGVVNVNAIFIFLFNNNTFLLMQENKIESSQLRLIKSSRFIEESGRHQNVCLQSKVSLNESKNERSPSPSRSKLGSTNKATQIRRKIEQCKIVSQLKFKILNESTQLIAQMQKQIDRLNYELRKQAEDLKMEQLKSQQFYKAKEQKMKQYKIKLDTNLENKNKELHQSIKQAARTIVGTADKIIRELYHELDSERKKHSNQTSKDIQMKAEGHFQVSAEVLRQEDENYKPTEQLQATHQLHSLTQTCEQKMNKIRFLFNELLQIKAKPNSTFVGHGVSSNQPKQNQDMIFKSQTGTKNEKKEGQKTIPFFQLIAAFLTGAALVIIFNKVRA